MSGQCFTIETNVLEGQDGPNPFLVQRQPVVEINEFNLNRKFVSWEETGKFSLDIGVRRICLQTLDYMHRQMRKSEWQLSWKNVMRMAKWFEVTMKEFGIKMKRSVIKTVMGYYVYLQLTTEPEIEIKKGGPQLQATITSVLLSAIDTVRGHLAAAWWVSSVGSDDWNQWSRGLPEEIIEGRVGMDQEAKRLCLRLLDGILYDGGNGVHFYPIEILRAIRNVRSVLAEFGIQLIYEWRRGVEKQITFIWITTCPEINVCTSEKEMRKAVGVGLMEAVRRVRLHLMEVWNLEIQTETETNDWKEEEIMED